MKSESFNKPESDIEKKSLQQHYHNLLESYYGKFLELRKIQRKNPGGATDPEVKSSMQIIDRERHQVHLKLIEIGTKLEKDKNDVMLDILKSEGSLYDYNLPEFSIKTAEDELNNEKLFQQDEVFLIFAITTMDAETDEMAPPEDYEERKKRAEGLAKEIAGRLVNGEEGSRHESVLLLGVVFPKKDLEHVAAIIRDNPKKFRLGKEFYE